MDTDEEIESASNQREFRIGRKYSPVVAQDTDRAVVEMSSLDPGSSSSIKLVLILFISFPLVFFHSHWYCIVLIHNINLLIDELK